MVFKDVLPSRSEVVNLEVIATGPYNPADSASNGINAKKLGQINVASSSSVDLLFRLVEDSTWHPVALSGPLCVSVFNLEDEITIGGFSQSALEEHSLLQVVNDSFGLTHVSGPSWPDTRADPNTTRELEFVQPAALGSPNLTAAQRRRTVTFMFTSGPEFQLSFSAGASPVSGVTGGRDFIFGGLSPFVTIGA
jgi:hypothetical protein